MSSYIALLRKEAQSDFGVDFPDFPGCITAGKTLEEAQKNAEEALEFHIKGLTEDGEIIPEPSSIDEIMASPEHSDAVAVIVNVSDPKPKRINITIPESDLKAIDNYRRRKNLSRSAFFREAAKRTMT